MNRIYGYLRASTKSQDAHRAKTALEDFAKKANQTISSWFTENIKDIPLTLNYTKISLTF